MKQNIIIQRIKLLLSLLALIPITANSQKDFYIPKSLIIPVHTHEHELHLSFGEGGGIDGNISYTFSKHLAVFATGTYNKGPVQRTALLGGKYKIFKNDYAIKGGLGYFSVINKPLLRRYNIF